MTREANSGKEIYHPQLTEDEKTYCHNGIFDAGCDLKGRQLQNRWYLLYADFCQYCDGVA